jgi:hypothetical protein
MEIASRFQLAIDFGEVPNTSFAHRDISKLNALGLCVANSKCDKRDVIPFAAGPASPLYTNGVALHFIHLEPETNLMV